MPIDASIYGSFMDRNQNPAAQIYEYSGALRSITENKLLQQMYGERQGVAAAMQASTDQNGNVDWRKAISQLAQNPATAWNLPQRVGEFYANQQSQQGAIKAALDNTQTVQSIIGKSATSLVNAANGAPITDEDISATLSSLYHDLKVSGATDMDPDIIGRILGVGAQLTGLPKDGPQREQVLRQLGVNSLNAAEAVGKVYPNLQAIDQGPNVALVQPRSMAMGTPPTVASVPLGVPPGTMQPSVGPGLTPQTQPLGSLIGQPPVGAQPVGPQAQAAPQPQPAPTPGAATGGGGGATSPSQTAAAPPAPAPRPGPIQTAPSPVQNASFNRFEDEYKGVQDQVKQGQVMMLQLKEAEGLLSKIQPGGGAEARAQAAQVAQALQNAIPGLHINPKTVDEIGNGNLAASQEMMKLAYANALQFAHTIVGASGLRSQVEQNMALQRNPSLDTDPRAIQRMYDLTNHIFNYAQIKLQAMKHAEGDFQQGNYEPVRTFDADWDKWLSSRGWTSLNPERKAALKKMYGTLPQAGVQ